MNEFVDYLKMIFRVMFFTVFTVALVVVVYLYFFKLMAFVFGAYYQKCIKVVYALFAAVFVGFVYFESKYWAKISRWMQTGKFDDYSNMTDGEARQYWLRHHTVRKIPKVWYFNLSNNILYTILEPIYPMKNGEPDKSAPIQRYQAIANITPRFKGDFPIAGDKINFTWKTKSDRDVSAVRICAVENNRMGGFSKILSDDADEKSICMQHISAGKALKIKHSLKITENVINGISLCIWTLPEETDGSVEFYKSR